MNDLPLARIAAAAGILSAAALLVMPGPAVAGPPFRTDDPVPVDYQHWEIYVFSQGTHKQGDTSGTLPEVEINYGAAPNLQLHVAAPFGTFDKPDGSAGTKFGYGDTELGVKYRFIEESEQGWWPQVAVFPTYEAPTGNLQRGLGSGRGHEYLPVWDSISAVFTISPTIITCCSRPDGEFKTRRQPTNFRIIWPSN